MAQNQEDIMKKKHKICSCLDIIKRAFARQQSGLPFTQTDVQSQNKIPVQVFGITDATTGSTFLAGDLSSQAFMINGGNCNFTTQTNALQLQKAQTKTSSEEKQEEHVFRFIQRNEFLQRKFAPKKDLTLNKNNRQISNFSIKTILEGDEIKYCEELNDNYFLLKYFKYQCQSCSILSSHILTVDCCKTPICLKCTQDLADQIEIEGNLTYCVFCHRSIQRLFTIRDPFQAEQRFLAKKTQENIKNNAFQKSQTGAGRLSQIEKGLDLSELQNSQLSGVKPQKLDFFCDMQTATSLKRHLDFQYGCGDKILSAFDDILMSASSNDNNSPNLIGLDSHKDFSTKEYTNHNTLKENDNFINKMRNNNNDKYLNDEIEIVVNKSYSVLSETKPQEPHRYIGSRKRVGNLKKIFVNSGSNKTQSLQGIKDISFDSNFFNSKEDQSLEETQDLPKSKRLRGRKSQNDENINFQNINSSKSGSSSPGIHKLSKKIKKV